MEPSSYSEISKTCITNLEYVLNILERVDEDQLNASVYPNKRSMGELITHILKVNTMPVFLEVFMFKYYAKFEIKPLDVLWYDWNLEKGLAKEIKIASKAKLLKKGKKALEKRKKVFGKLKEKQRLAIHRSVQHMSIHTKQLRQLYDELIKP
ncbi:MAG: hypothetical protein GPJ54_09275 [Candidatus Heimdallarchaeota archaeon]|nr:hypothetical protein [Candidatus Heimdallarchaeota archaeon]